jgi:hypothetical protein
MTGDDFSDSFYYRAIRTKIGEALRSQLLAKEPPPERVLDLLQEFDQADGDGVGGTKENPSTRRTTAATEVRGLRRPQRSDVT